MLRMADIPLGYEHAMRDVIERHQVWAYLIAVVFGLSVDWTSSLGDSVPDYLIWGLLGVLQLHEPALHVHVIHRDVCMQGFRRVLLFWRFLGLCAMDRCSMEAG